MKETLNKNQFTNWCIELAKTCYSIILRKNTEYIHLFFVCLSSPLVFLVCCWYYNFFLDDYNRKEKREMATSPPLQYVLCTRYIILLYQDNSKENVFLDSSSSFPCYDASLWTYSLASCQSRLVNPITFTRRPIHKEIFEAKVSSTYVWVHFSKSSPSLRMRRWLEALSTGNMASILQVIRDEKGQLREKRESDKSIICGEF